MLHIIQLLIVVLLCKSCFHEVVFIPSVSNIFYDSLDVITESEDHKTFLGKRHLVSFLSWLDYCDQLISIANPMVAKTLAKSIRELFLNVIMEPSVLQA